MKEVFVPLGDNVLLERLEDVPQGRIFLPDMYKEKPIRAEVVAVGPGEEHPMTGELIPPKIKAGQVVVIGKFSGVEFKLDGREHLVVKERDLLGLVVKSD